MTTPRKTKLDWQADEACQERAGQEADALVERLGLSVPIDPLTVARTEHAFLRTGGDDLGDRYDGKLEYVPQKKRFLLYYNTKYNRSMPDGVHHPRTRFSIGHELGHYFLEQHRSDLVNGEQPHGSSGEFKNASLKEREADAFAASLLLPTHLVSRKLNNGELTLTTIDAVAIDFQASLLCTARRGVRLSDQPCALAGLREGKIAWLFPSKSLIEAKIYPGKKTIESPVALARWAAFQVGDNERQQEDGLLRHWFQTYGRDEELHEVEVTQSFLPVPVMGTLAVLLTMTEEDVLPHEEEEEEDEIDRNHRERFGW
ncbi:MAG: ImmA/IrrE family metallo-endopeptidase [Gemmataceae bacterium]